MKRAFLLFFALLVMALSGACSGAPSGAVPTGDDGGMSEGGPTCAILSLSALTQDFGSIVVGQQSAPVLVNVTNTGSCETGALSASVGGSDAASFVANAGCNGQTLATGAMCSISMTFLPSSAGSKTAVLSVTGSHGESAHVPLTGLATPPATITLLPATQDFGTVVVGASSFPTTFTLSNDGTTTTGMVAIGVVGPDQEQFKKSSDTCTGQTLAPSKTCSVAVTFTAVTSGSKMAALAATIAGGSTVSSMLTGVGAGGATFSVTPAMYDFGSLTMGVTSAASTFLVKNTGGVPSGSPTIAVTGAQLADFAVTNLCKAALAPNGSCTFSIAFTPSTSLPETAAVNVTAPGTASAPTVNLTGTGLKPAALQASPMTNDFGPIAQGSTSPDVTFVFANTGMTTTSPLMVALSGTGKDQFGFGTDTCTNTQLKGAATCSVAVHFAPNPTSYGAVQAQLLVQGNIGGTVSVSLSGTAETRPVLAIGPPTYSFGLQALGTPTGTVQFTVTNSGSMASGPPSVAQAGSGDFTIVSDTCVDATGAGIPVAGNSGTCTIGVRFNPSMSAPESGSITVNANPGGSVTATFTGTGATPASLRITPAQFDYMVVMDNVASPPATFTVTNTGGVASGNLAAPAFNGANRTDFHVTSDGCKGKTLAANGASTCAVMVSFDPTTGASESATLTESDNQGHNGSAFLSGTGVTGASLSVSPAGNFTSVNVGTPTTLQFSVSNNGGTASSTPVVTITGNADFKITANTCTQGIPPHTANACTVTVTFTPSTATNETASLVVTASQGGTTVPLQGVGLAPKIGVSPTSGSFAASASKAQSVQFTVTNTGNAPTANTPTITGLPSAGFSLATMPASTCTAPLAALKSCSFSVQFQPSASEVAATVDKATVTVTDTATDTAQAALTGTVLAPALTITPASPISFTKATATLPQSMVLTVKNTGSAPTNALGVSGLPASGFSIAASNTCAGAVVPVGMTCTFSVVYQPTAGEKAGTMDTATVTVSDTAPATETAKATLNGSAQAASLTLSPTSQAFDASTPTPPQKFTITNGGTIPATGVTISGLPANGFSIATSPASTCTGMIAMGGSCAFSVQYQPSPSEMPGTMDTATISVSDTAGDMVTPATLTGNPGAAKLTISPNPATFAPSILGNPVAQTFTVTNGGTLDSGMLTMPTISSSQSGLTVANDNCTTKTLAPTQTCTYDIVFTPPAPGDGGLVGSFTGSTSVTDNVVPPGTATFNGSYF